MWPARADGVRPTRSIFQKDCTQRQAARGRLASEIVVSGQKCRSRGANEIAEDKVRPLVCDFCNQMVDLDRARGTKRSATISPPEASVISRAMRLISQPQI